MRQRTIPVSVCRTAEDAVVDLGAYREMYPRRTFDIELRDDGHEAPWRVVLRIGRKRPWQHVPPVSHGPFSRFLGDIYRQAIDPLRTYAGRTGR